MVKFIVWIFTLIMLVACILTTKDKGLKIKIFFSSINKAFIKFGKSSGKIVSTLLVIVAVLVFFQIVKLSYQNIISQTYEVLSLKTIFLTIILLLITTVFMYLLVGMPLMLFSSVENLINKIKNNKISNQFMVSFLILTIYSFFLVVGKNEMIEAGWLIISGLLLSYIINIKLLINVILNPLCFFTTDECEKFQDKKHIMKVTLSAAILLLILVVANLYLAVLMVWYTWPDSYYCSLPSASINEFDLFYYTVVSFTTIGYGDIVPCVIQSKITAVLIAFTSVLCLVIFIGSALSAKEKLSETKSNRYSVFKNGKRNRHRRFHP